MGDLFVSFSPFLLHSSSITGANDRLDVSANVKIAFDFDFERVARLNEIFQNDINDVLVKNLYFAE